MQGKDVFDVRLGIEVSVDGGFVFVADLVERSSCKVVDTVTAGNMTILFKALVEAGYRASRFFIKGEDGFWHQVGR